MSEPVTASRVSRDLSGANFYSNYIAALLAAGLDREADELMQARVDLQRARALLEDQRPGPGPGTNAIAFVASPPSREIAERRLSRALDRYEQAEEAARDAAHRWMANQGFLDGNEGGVG